MPFIHLKLMTLVAHEVYSINQKRVSSFFFLSVLTPGYEIRLMNFVIIVLSTSMIFNISVLVQFTLLLLFFSWFIYVVITRFLTVAYIACKNSMLTCSMTPCLFKAYFIL